MSNRREFLKFLAASPLLGGLPAAVPGMAQALAQTAEFVPANPAQALNVFEIEAAARKALPPAHWGYIASGVDDDETLKANRDGFAHYQVRARRFVDALLDRGVICRDTHTWTLRFAPPLTISREDLDWGLERIESVLTEGA